MSDSENGPLGNGTEDIFLWLGRLTVEKVPFLPLALYFLHVCIFSYFSFPLVRNILLA